MFLKSCSDLNMERATLKYAPHRIVGYSATLLMHIGNIFYMGHGLNLEAIEDENIRNFAQLQSRFFTCWTFFVQILYAAAALISDIQLLRNAGNKNYEELKLLRNFRKYLYAAILWPSSLLVTSVFWSVYLYDRNLIFPPFVDKILTQTSNHIIHTAIIPVALWELVYRPRVKPSAHAMYIGHLTFHMLLYMSVLLYTYYERGVWLYPIFKILYGTVYFPLIFVFIGVILFYYYHAQWIISSLIWGNLENKRKKNK